MEEVALSPDGRTVAYAVAMRDQPGRPYAQLWVADIATQKSTRVGGEHATGASPHWSPDGKWIAYEGADGNQNGLWVAHADGSGAAVVAPIASSNAPLPDRGQDITWSPDSKQIAFVSSIPGPETEAANGDPKVFTRYLYHATADEGFTHFNDNRHLHIFIVDLASKQVKQLTKGIRDEHSIDWSPDGKHIVFISNYDPNDDEFFNYDVFTVDPDDGNIRRLTSTENAEYAPVWSPDGKHIAYSATTRGLTDRETTMEDTHAWVMDADGGHRHEIGTTDARQGHPQWSPDGAAVYVSAEQRGSVHLLRIPVSPAGVAGTPQVVINDLGWAYVFSPGKAGQVAYAFTTPRDMAELYVRPAAGAPKKLTDLNSAILAGKQIASVDSVVAISNDNKYDVESFLVMPIGLAVNAQDTSPAKKYPLIVEIHGGPHGQNGVEFEFQDQIYAAHGYATLHVNYRGSTGYGQKFADAVFGDQDGNEAQDVLYAVSATLAAPSLDRSRPAGHRRGQLRWPTHGLADHADQRVQGRGADGRHQQSRELQLHHVLQPVPRDGVRPVPPSGHDNGSGLESLGDQIRGAGAHADHVHARRERSQCADRRGGAVLRRAQGRRGGDDLRAVSAGGAWPGGNEAHHRCDRA